MANTKPTKNFAQKGHLGRVDRFDMGVNQKFSLAQFSAYFRTKVALFPTIYRTVDLPEVLELRSNSFSAP